MYFSILTNGAPRVFENEGGIQQQSNMLSGNNFSSGKNVLYFTIFPPKNRAVSKQKSSL